MDEREKMIDQRIVEGRKTGMYEASFVKPDTRNVAEKIMEASTALATEAFNIMQANIDNAPVDAIVIELNDRSEDGRLKIRYVYE